MSKTSPIVGIDLGTTNSVVSFLKEDKTPETLLIDNNKLLPSVVSLTDKGFIVGQVAKNMAILEPQNTIVSIKRKMGQNIVLSLGLMEMKPEEISALILKKIKAQVIEHYGLKEGDEIRAVITVPAYFTEEQRQATKEAAQLAGFQLERIINEPTAAALAFGISKMEEASYAIYDFGGGTFDVSIIESTEGLVEVLASTGDNQLGGDDLDELLANFIWERFLEDNELDKNTPRSDKEIARLIRVAEQTKIKLSSQYQVDIQESFFFNIDKMSYHLEQQILREEFEDLIKPKVEETVKHLKNAIQEAQLTVEDLDGIILVGGSSRIPLITKTIEEKLGISPTLIDLPDEAVAHGATIQAAIIDKIDIETVLVDITPHTLGISSMDSLSFMQLYQHNIEEENPELDLAASTIISKNTPIPVRRSEKFGAIHPFQKGYEVKIFQGEEARFKDNKQIGELYLEVKRPIENGEIEVFFELDLNGILQVTAVETTTREKVEGEFKSSRGKKIQQSKLDKALMLSMDEAENTLIGRAEKILKTPDINAEDKEELEGLINDFKTQQLAKKDTSEVETQILDLLYFLEGEE